MQVLGGYGYCTEYRVERFCRDAKLLEIGGGTLEAHQKNITRELMAAWADAARPRRPARAGLGARVSATDSSVKAMVPRQAIRGVPWGVLPGGGAR